MPLPSATVVSAMAWLMIAAVAAPPRAAAQEDQEERRGEPAPAIDPSTGRALQEAIDFLNAEDYASAREAIKDLRLDRLSPYERSRVEQILFSIDFSEQNYASARSHLLEAIKAGGLNEQELSQARYQIAQLYLAEEKWGEGAKALEEWFATESKPNAAAYYLLAVAYYQLEDFDRALPAAERAIELMEKPQENWLQLALGLRLQREEYRQALPLLERLIALAPDRKTYWLQLSSIYGQLSMYEEALAVLQLANSAGLLDEDTEFLQLADLFVLNEIPYRAARMLEQAIASNVVAVNVRSYQKLADCWIAAREYDQSIEPLRQAAELDATGDLFVRLGEVQVQREDWPAATEALQRGIDKGALKDAGKAELLLGIAHLNQKKLPQAREWFVRAAKSDRHGRIANSYIGLIDAQQE